MAPTRDELPWGAALTFALGIGIAIVLLYGGFQPNPGQAIAVALFIAGAASAAGMFVGFLFGIPRSLQREPQTGGALNKVQSSNGQYAVNTNLEQISDWLTKIIVGVGFGAAERAASTGAHSSGLPWYVIWITGRSKPDYSINYLLFCEEYNTRFGPSSERVWEYLACAYGQQYDYLSRAPKRDEAAMKLARDKALEAVQRALQINPETKTLLTGLWDPQQAKPGEDDLAVFGAEWKTKLFALRKRDKVQIAGKYRDSTSPFMLDGQSVQLVEPAVA